jgi:hypothetical protein
MRGPVSMDRLVVNSRYLLFRYLDFEVESGMAYRYRVRLQLRNPNFELTPEELGIGDPEITKGPVRETPWSNISNAEVVPSTVNYYLARVEREPYAEEKVKINLGKPVAQLKIFDWDPKKGTVVTDFLNIPAIGGFIAEARKDTVVLNLAEGFLEKEKEHKFATLNVLVDLEADVEVTADQHPDLKLAAVDKRGLTRLGLLPEALIATESGELDALDPFSEKAEELNWARRVEFERKGFEYDDPAARAGTRLDDLTNVGKSDGKGKKKKKKKSARKGKSKAAATATMQAGPGAMMPPPGGMPANGPGAPRRR